MGVGAGKLVTFGLNILASRLGGKSLELFRYDAERERLVRVSIGEAGFNDAGNVTAFAKAPRIARKAPEYASYDQPTEANRTTVSDGGTVFFESSDALVGQAIQAANNVYEYRDGHVYLVSDGSDASLTHYERSVYLFGANASGADVFFETRDQLVPQDSDTQVDLYDAHTGGGFPAPALAPGCIGETCRGATESAPQLGLAGSASQTGGGNIAPATSKPAIKKKPLSRAQKLANALKACKKKPRKKRAACVKRAKKSYGAKSKAAKSDRRGK